MGLSDEMGAAHEMGCCAARDGIELIDATFSNFRLDTIGIFLKKYLRYQNPLW